MSDRPKILVVDDNRAMREALMHLMQKEGCAVAAAGTGAEAIERASEFGPDLVLLDVVLPDQNGYEVARAIKAQPATASCFIIHLTAQLTAAENIAAGFEAGADDYLVLPLPNKELVARIRSFLRHKKASDSLRESERTYRELFENSPQPMWIYARSGGQFLAVNNAAVAHYGFAREKFLSFKIADILYQSPDCSELVPNKVYECKHATSSGAAIDVAVVEQDITWEGQPARISSILDITARKAAEQSQQQLLKEYERELELLKGWTASPAQRRPTLRDGAPAEFKNLTASYTKLIQLSLKEEVYRVERTSPALVQELVGKFRRLNSSPRDVVEVHSAAMASLGAESTKGSGYLEVGRILLIEILGNLAGAYRESLLSAA